MKKIIKQVAICAVGALLIAGAALDNEKVDAKQKKLPSVKASVKNTKVSVGKQTQVKTQTKNVTYTSSDKNIAYISKEGVITGKKAGDVTITVKRKGYSKKTLSIHVAARKRKPSISVCPDEVRLSSAKIEQDETGAILYSAVIQNKSNKKTIKKAVYTYQIYSASETEVVSGSAVQTQEEKTVTLTATNIKPGKSSDRVSCEGDASVELLGMTLYKVQIYAGNAVCTYYPSDEKLTLDWSTQDKKAPVFHGLVGTNSYNGKDIYRTYYSDQKSSYNFKKYVSATDDRDGEVEVKADTSHINWKKSGVYKIYYTAKDRAGNTKKTWAKVRVLIPGTAESIADSILKSIIKKDDSNRAKARAIYSYVKGHISYSAAGQGWGSWRSVAIRGIRYRTGNCYTYYSTTRLLMTRAGIPNIQIKRYPTYIGRHYWNLIYVNGGWYHLDTTPRSVDGRFCLLIDSQIAYWRGGTATFSFQKNKYPKRATEKISPNP